MELPELITRLDQTPSAELRADAAGYLEEALADSFAGLAEHPDMAACLLTEQNGTFRKVTTIEGWDGFAVQVGDAWKKVASAGPLTTEAVKLHDYWVKQAEQADSGSGSHNQPAAQRREDGQVGQDRQPDRRGPGRGNNAGGGKRQGRGQ